MTAVIAIEDRSFSEVNRFLQVFFSEVIISYSLYSKNIPGNLELNFGEEHWEGEAGQQLRFVRCECQKEF